MNAELICVGSEILSGKIVNTNAQFISKRLVQLGHTCTRQFTVDDNKSRIASLVKNSISNCDLLIVTGGLGPTDDDVTKEAVCEALGLELVENKKLKNHIETFFNRLGKTPTQNNYKQATAPNNSVIFKNDKGTACGLGIELHGKVVVLLPGPPKELTHMFNNYVVPYLHKFDSKVVVTHTLSVFGMGESAIEVAIKPLMVSDGPIIATYCKENECEISVTATASSQEAAELICSNTIFKIKAILGDVVYGTDSTGMASEVVNMLRKAGLKVATAESCTGGMLSSSLTSVSGASEAVEIGILAYSNRIKNEALSVPQDVLMEEGAISAETAMYLAKNVRILSGADIGVGITGNAGPTAQENKPVGLVYIAIADKNNYCIKKLELPETYSRDRIRDYATLAALDLVRKYILARPNSLANMRSLEEDFFFDEQADSLSSDVSENKFAIFEVDENYNFDDVEPEKAENDPDVIIDINSFLTFSDAKSPEIFKICKQFIFKHWIKLVSAFVLLALLISSTVLVSNFTHENHQIKLICEAREQFNYDDASKHAETGLFSGFDSLMSDNSNIKAWIKIDGTEIDNPVYQTDNNKYYQNHNMANKKSRYGALFFDSNNNIENDSISQNLTIYGHNTTNGIMFGELDQYRSLSYYKNHPTIKLKTLYNQNEYLIFAIFVTNATPEDDNGNIFNYAKSNFNNAVELSAFINEAKKRSVINVPVDIHFQDEIITLSTHSTEFENARFVVMAKKVITPNEINISKNATLNPNAKYPQAWYDKNGLKGYKENQNEESSSIFEESSTEASSIIENASSDAADSSSQDGVSSSEISSITDTSSEQASSTVEPTACIHSYSGKYEHKDATNHTYICSLCGQTVVEAHIFTFERVEPGYYCSPATCLSPALYFKSCVCGIKGTETFAHGDKLNHHIPLLNVFNKDDQYHWNPCQTVGCTERLNLTEHVYGETGSCACSHSNQPTE